jgi:hypothetical protein
VKVYFSIQDFGHLKSFFFQLNKFILSFPINVRGLNMIDLGFFFLIEFGLVFVDGLMETYKLMYLIIFTFSF